MNPLDKKLYELFADKTLSEWCIIEEWWNFYTAFNFSTSYKNARFWSEEDEEVLMLMKWAYKVIWHPPEIDDVFRVANEKGYWMASSHEIMWIRREIWDVATEIVYNPTLPLLSQSDETKQAIISLFE